MSTSWLADFKRHCFDSAPPTPHVPAAGIVMIKRERKIIVITIITIMIIVIAILIHGRSLLAVQPTLASVHAPTYSRSSLPGRLYSASV